MAEQTPLEIDIDRDLEATMRDGAVLRADAYRPPGAGPWPVLLARTPYGKQDPDVLARLDPLAAARRGYLVVIQDCRGRFRSEGHWVPLVHESTDGYETVAWAARLPGADGRVGMYGPSYLGHTQWAALAAQPPCLHAAVPEFTWSDPQDGLIGRGGAYELGLVTQWTLTLGFNVLERRYADRPAAVLQRRLAELSTALDDLTTRTYWELPARRPRSVRRLGLPMPTSAHRPDHRARSAVPTLIVAGWFDSFLQGSLDNHAKTRDAGGSAALIVGPWSHDNQTSRVGEVDFGATADSAAVDQGGSLLKRKLDWLDQYLKQRPVTPAPPVLVFVMGTNRWRHIEAWPPPSIDVPWYLHADGALSLDSPEPASPPDVFHHDPHDPVPTCGGALLMPRDFPAGPFDQHQVEKRDDVLVYTSEPMAAPIEVIGRVRVHLAADSTARTTDWVARLCDVDTAGVSRNITDGILRSEHPATEYVIDLWSTAHVFLPGHRIRLQVASSCFPRWDRNFGSSGATAARQSVYHDAARPSCVVLPVAEATVPGKRDPAQA